MTKDEAIMALNLAGLVITEEKRLGNESGLQLRIDNGAIVNIYDKGTHYVQGKNKEQVEAILAGGSSQGHKRPVVTDVAPTQTESISHAPITTINQSVTETIFVVHGHDVLAREQLELVLHQLGLNPFILASTGGGGLTIIEALEENIGLDSNRIRFGIVLLTPDDRGYLEKDGQDSAEPRARQNVVLEMGMLISSLGRSNVAILKKGHLEVPSDASGIIYIPFNYHVKETVPKLCDRFRDAGFDIEHLEKLLNETGDGPDESPLTIDLAGLIENVQGVAREQVAYMVDMAKADALELLGEYKKAAEMVERHV